ncbi:MAG: hypothetical protein AAGJ35_13230, partial [Myxococcota bacterium]
RNQEGQMGLGHTMPVYAPAEQPIQIPGEHKVVSVAAGDDHICALLDDQTVRCWGNNIKGQLGYGNLTLRTAPSAMPIVEKP